VALDSGEEENIEALKKWWDENGKPLATAVVVILAGYGGWLFWQNGQVAASDAASDVYEEILVLALTEPGTPVSGEESAKILELSQDLMQSHQDTIYARYGALFSAQQQVANNDLDAAEESLRWILENPRSGFFEEEDEGLVLTATLRLGRILLSNGEAESALTIVNNVDPKAFEAGFSELRGDIYVTMDRLLDARDSYVASQQAGSNSEALQMKLDELPEET
jgi:predicted negative regulator of RcsB-dependent stress response